MTQDHKDHLLKAARDHINQTVQTVRQLVDKLDQTIAKGPGTFYTSESDTAFEDEMRAMAAATNTSYIREQMAELAESPYFARCDLSFEDEPERAYYFAKYSASELGIYSWTSAIATLRFEQPGEVTYRTPRGARREGSLTRRDQYMIAQGHLNFMTTETVGSERDLVYQEHFSSRKTGFVLPEVVAQMEKAQDQVIRAHPRGPFAISGPAGSGKTTLALHRIAYLRQSPETTELYPPESILVLVQDPATDDYFSHLLPELGIHDVRITTFAAWAIATLGIGHMFYHPRPGRTEAERDGYEFAKLRALRGVLPIAGKVNLKQPQRLLLAHYRSYLNDAQLDLLREELDEGAVDRYDLTLLLLLAQAASGTLTTTFEETYHRTAKRTERRMVTKPLEYSLILIDEFQNYLPEQLRLLKGTVGRTNSMLYIGDFAQQTQFGSVGSWADFGELIPEDRAIKLQKVYRNTRQILEYIQGLGYSVDLPPGIAEGAPVVEHGAHDVVEALEYIVSLKRPAGTLLGIIAKDPADLAAYRDYFAHDDTVRCLTMREAQGVEFDIVCLVGVTEHTFVADESDTLLAAEQQRINRDLLYVALTRAMRELHIVGPVGLA